MSARLAAPTVGLSSLAERRPSAHFKLFWFRWNVHSVFRRVVESLALVTRNARRLCWNINTRSSARMDTAIASATSLCERWFIFRLYVQSPDDDHLSLQQVASDHLLKSFHESVKRLHFR